MHDFPVVEVGGIAFDLSSIIAITVSFLIVLVLALLSVRNLSVTNPSKLQNFLEWVVDFVHNTIASTMPLEKAKRYISLGMTLILFIFVSNLLGLPFGIVTEVKESHHGPGSKCSAWSSRRRMKWSKRTRRANIWRLPGGNRPPRT
jgi:F-type H+-transporting ATPase subunit a